MCLHSLSTIINSTPIGDIQQFSTLYSYLKLNILLHIYIENSIDTII